MTSQRATPRSLWSRPSRTRLFATTRPAVRSRRPTDALLLVLCALALFGVVKTSSPPSGFWYGMADFATSLPGFFDVLWRAGLWLMSGWAVILVAAGLVCKRFDVVRDQVLALGGSIVAVVIVEAALGGTSRSLWDAAVAVGPPPDPVSVRVALAVAITVGASPSITRPFRAIGWWLIAAGALSVSVLAVAAPSGVVLGFLCGVSGAASVHLVFGSIGGQPSLAQVSKGMTDLGVQFGSLSEATAQEAGVYTATATDSAGCPLLVRVYGRDAWDAQLLANVWRAVWFRGAAPPASSRLQQIEHEGFLTLLAARNDIPTQDVVRAGKTADNDAIIVIRVRGTPLAAEDGKLSPEAIDAIWDTVLALGAAGIAHGDLHAGAFRVDGSRAVIDSMASASVATNLDRRYIDLAQLLTLTAEALGTDKAVAIAQRRLAAADLAGVVPYVQKAALGPGLREVTGRRHFDVDDLRARIASEAGVEAPKMASIRRVSTRGLVEAALLVAAAYFLISTIAEVDINEVLDALRAASLPLLLLALVVGQLPRFAYGESTRAACPRPIPYGPPVLLQFSVTFVNLVFPSTVGRMALNIRFFQRQGIPPAVRGVDRGDRELCRVHRPGLHLAGRSRFWLRWDPRRSPEIQPRQRRSS